MVYLARRVIQDQWVGKQWKFTQREIKCMGLTQYTTYTCHSLSTISLHHCNQWITYYENRFAITRRIMNFGRYQRRRSSHLTILSAFSYFHLYRNTSIVKVMFIVLAQLYRWSKDIIIYPLTGTDHKLISFESQLSCAHVTPLSLEALVVRHSYNCSHCSRYQVSLLIYSWVISNIE